MAFRKQKWKIALAQANNTVSGISAKFANAMTSLGITFTGDSVTGNETTDRITVLEPIVQNVTANATISLGNYLIAANATIADLTVTIPTAVDNSGYKYTVVKTDSSANVVTIDSVSLLAGETDIDLLHEQESLTFFSDGTEWMVK